MVYDIRAPDFWKLPVGAVASALISRAERGEDHVKASCDGINEVHNRAREGTVDDRSFNVGRVGSMSVYLYIHIYIHILHM